MTAPKPKEATVPKGAARRPARSAPKALMFIAVCFVASAAARVGEVGAQAVDGARLAADEPTALPDAEATPAEGEPEACEAEPGPLLRALREQSAALETRETRLVERERLLEIAETRVKEEIALLEQAEAKLAATLSIADGAAERDVAHLVGVYEAMKPVEAAKIFEEMEPSFAAGFLGRMSPQSAAGVLAAMPNQSAYAVTLIMASRNMRAPTE
jgi:flagellar motility protein MotE (MotC chaperone)